MNILIAGASGFIGRELVKALKDKNQLTLLGRNDKKIQATFPPGIAITTWQKLSSLNAKSFDIIINLCGKNIASSRWSNKTKQELIKSRTETNFQLINWLITQSAKPRYFCANAVGIYGLQKNSDSALLDESSIIDFASPKDFLSEIGIRWQESLDLAIEHNIPVTTLRFGIVFKKDQGFLKKLLPSFQIGLGTILGDGQQSLSWIHIDDALRAILFILAQPHLSGAFNITSPYPISQKEFASLFAQVLNRPLLLKMPGSLINILFGEMGNTLLLQGQQVIPKRLLDLDFKFLYPTCKEALEHELLAN